MYTILYTLYYILYYTIHYTLHIHYICIYAFNHYIHTIHKNLQFALAKKISTAKNAYKQDDNTVMTH